MKPRLYAFAVAGIGVFALKSMHLPLHWLLGPIFACLIASIAGVPMRGIKPVNEAMRTILGIAVGTTFTTTLLGSMVGMWPTLLMAPVMTGCTGIVGVLYFQRHWGNDFATCYYSSMPRGLQDMLVFSEEAGGDVPALSLVHATRVRVIVVVLPLLPTRAWDADLSSPASSVAPAQLALMGTSRRLMILWPVPSRTGPLMPRKAVRDRLRDCSYGSARLRQRR